MYFSWLLYRDYYNDDIVKYLSKYEFYCQSLHIIHESIKQTYKQKKNKQTIN